MTGKETEYIRQAVESGKISGNGEFTKRCQRYFEERYGFRKCLLATSGTDALGDRRRQGGAAEGRDRMARRALGSIGHLGCFSFHETKNVISGEGGRGAAEAL